MKKTKAEKKLYQQKIHKKRTEVNKKRRKDFLKGKKKRKVKIVSIEKIEKKDLKTKVIQPEVIEMIPFPIKELKFDEEKLLTKIKNNAKNILRHLWKRN